MLLFKIKACFNSRPIYSLTENLNDPVALTPGHFLIGSPSLIPAEPKFLDCLSSIIRHWQRLNPYTKAFATVGKEIISTNPKIEEGMVVMDGTPIFRPTNGD